MNYTPASKLFAITPPFAKSNNASIGTATIDTLGFKFLRIIVFLGDTDIAMAALKVQESDDSGMSGAADISGLVGGTDFTLPSATGDNSFYVFNIQLKGNRKRYIDLVATSGSGSTGTFFTAMAELSHGETAPSSATNRGLALEVSV